MDAARVAMKHTSDAGRAALDAVGVARDALCPRARRLIDASFPPESHDRADTKLPGCQGPLAQEVGPALSVCAHLFSLRRACSVTIDCFPAPPSYLMHSSSSSSFSSGPGGRQADGRCTAPRRLACD